MTIFDWFLKGGILMWPLLICSVIGLTVILDRFWAFLRASINYEMLTQRLQDHRANPQALERVLANYNSRSPVVRIALNFLDYRGEACSKRNQMLTRDGSRLLAEFERHLKILGAIAQASPLIGLLGTVLGLVIAFQQIQIIGASVQPSDLAGGIWAAMLTTVAGLAVAIPSVLAHQYFLARLSEMRRQMREVLIDLDAIWTEETADETSAVTAAQPKAPSPAPAFRPSTATA